MVKANQQKVILRTPRLTLRAARATDLGDFYAIFSNTEVMNYWSCAPHTDPSQTKEYLDSMIASPTNGVLEFAIVISSLSVRPHKDDDDGEVIGKIGIWSAENCEIGFILNRSFWGKGYMVEVMTVLLPHLHESGVQRIVADVDPRNVGSIGLLARFGFAETGREEKTGKVDGMWYDSVYFALDMEKGKRGTVNEQVLI